jgi:FSR family fosmidomycin resistance protein-like MFS transporter
VSPAGDAPSRVRRVQGTPTETGFQARRVATLAAGHSVHDTYAAFLPPLLPVFVEDFALSNTAAGALSAFVQIPSVIQPFVGHLADRRTLRWAVILGPGITAVLMSLLGWAGHYALLAVLLFGVGVNSAVFHAVGPPTVGRLSGTRLGRGMAFWMVGGELGRTIGPIVITTAVAWLTLRGAAVVMVAGIAATGVLYRQLRRAPLRSEAPDEPIPWRVGLRTMRRLMTLLGGIVVVRGLVMVATTTYLPIFLTHEGASLWLAGAALSLLEAAGIGGAMVGGWVSDHIGRRPVLLASYLVAPVALVAFVLTDGWVRVPLLVVLGSTLLAIQPVNLALAQEAAPGSRALANGVYLAMSFAVRSVATVGFGALADAFGLDAAFIVAGVVMAAGLPLVLAVPRHGPGAAGTPTR